MSSRAVKQLKITQNMPITVVQSKFPGQVQGYQDQSKASLQ